MMVRSFSLISFSHIFRDLNEEVEKMYKDGLHLAEEDWKLLDFNEGTCSFIMV
jgi:hypothetical protein